MPRAEALSATLFGIENTKRKHLQASFKGIELNDEVRKHLPAWRQKLLEVIERLQKEKQLEEAESKERREGGNET